MIYGQVLVDGLVVGLMFALVAMGLSLIYGVMNIVNFAHGEFMMLAMYFCFFAWSLFGIDPLVSTPLAAIADVLRRGGRLPPADPARARRLDGGADLRHLRPAALHPGGGELLVEDRRRSIPTSWAAGNFQVAGLFFSGPELVAGAGRAPHRGRAVLVHQPHRDRARAAGGRRGSAGGAADGDRFGPDVRNRVGRLVRGGGDRRRTAVDVLRDHAALPGSRWALPAFVAVAIGGFGSISGAFFGGMIIGVVQTAGGFFTSPSYKQLFVFALYLLVVFWRPYGLLGRR